jgi:hypothetical protein
MENERERNVRRVRGRRGQWSNYKEDAKAVYRGMRSSLRLSIEVQGPVPHSGWGDTSEPTPRIRDPPNCNTDIRSQYACAQSHTQDLPLPPFFLSTPLASLPNEKQSHSHHPQRAVPPHLCGPINCILHSLDSTGLDGRLYSSYANLPSVVVRAAFPFQRFLSALRSSSPKHARRFSA